MLSSVSHLGSVLSSLGKYDEAKVMHQRALKGREKVLGLEYPDMLVSIANLAFMLKSQSRNEEAISLMKNCVQLQKQILGPQHPDTESSLKAMNEWADEEHESSNRPSKRAKCS